MAKRGRKKIAEPMRTKTIRMTDSQRMKMSLAGDPEFWRAVIDCVSRNKIELDNGCLTLDGYAKSVGREVLEIAQEHA